MITSINTSGPLDFQKYEGLKPQIPKSPLKEPSEEASNAERTKSTGKAEKEKKTISEKTQELQEKKAEKAFSDEELRSFEDKINETLKDENLEIEFSKDEETDRMILKLIDKETQEVVHQYPPEITLKIARIVANSMDEGSITNIKV
mgnify:CR=1 FL=1